MQNENQLINARKQKLQRLDDLGANPYPRTTKRTHLISEIFTESEKFLENNDLKISIAGRIRSLRKMGKASFFHLEDRTGKIQVYIRRDEVGENEYKIFKCSDLGDFLNITGYVFKTQTGELSLRAGKVKFLAKAIRPLPTVKEKEEDGKKVRYDEFADKELRYRKRYLDLLLNPEVKETFQKRSKIIKMMRNFLDSRNFIEVETPILQPQYGGAAAQPFITKHNKLDMELFLRIADELYLKRLIIGGFERVYEVCKDFRNEGMDRTHNPEFTMIELYQAYADYNDVMDLVEDMLTEIATEICGSLEFEFDGNKINMERPWPRKPLLSLINEYAKINIQQMSLEEMIKFCDDHEIELEAKTYGKVIDEIFSTFVEPNLIQPTFVTDFPKEISPLAKSKPDNPKIAERFEIFIGGAEIGNAFTELNDPIDQRERLEEQAANRNLGDLEANEVDEDFLEAMEYGMPPTGGLGLGIDRIVMLFTNSHSIKDVIFFPQMRKKI
ncbi:MAG: lysine--tRNA ligase [Candidatus Cloacimonadota bacterium]|nr:lysine--tRNA ligase [Candidatus Cloacimonadota bacterium]